MFSRNGLALFSRDLFWGLDGIFSTFLLRDLDAFFLGDRFGNLPTFLLGDFMTMLTRNLSGYLVHHFVTFLPVAARVREICEFHLIVNLLINEVNIII